MTKINIISSGYPLTWAEPNKDQYWNRWSKGGSQLESPGKTPNAEEDQIRAEATIHPDWSDVPRSVVQQTYTKIPNATQS